MGFFAVLSEGNTPDFEVIHCHLNLWSLGGVLKHRNFLWDVGLRIRATSEGVSKFSLALPFGTSDGDLKDLKERMMNQKILEIIFGGPVIITGAPTGETISYDNLSPVKIVDIDLARSKLDKDKSDSNFSLWDIEISPPVRQQEEAYLRIRFRMRRPGRTWQWKRSFLAKYGALVDLRVADVRETWNVKDGPALKNRIVPLQRIYLFVIAPTWLQSRQVSPPTRYLRLLEGRAWKPYVGNASDIQMGKLLVYYWRNESLDVNDKLKEISKDNPFRAFLDLHREYGPSAWRDHFRTLLLVLILFLIYFTIVPNWNAIYETLKGFVGATWTWIVSLGVVGFVVFVFGWFKSIKEYLSKWDALRRILLSFEELLIAIKTWFKERWYG